MRSRWCWYGAAFVLSFAAYARAEPPVAVRLHYTAPPTCPTEAEFVDAVRARTPLARFGDDPNAWDVTVSAQTAAGKSSGILDGEGSAPREVSARRCTDVISALALILALAIDPQASATPAAEPEAEELPTLEETPPEPASRQRHGKRLRLVHPEPAPVVAVPERGGGGALFWGVGLAVAGTASFTSGWTAFLGPSASLELGVRWSPLLSPSVRLSGALDYGSAGTEAAGEADFRIGRGRLDLRPIRLELSSTFAALPFVGVEVGTLAGEGESGAAVTTTRTQRRLWLALAQGVALELALTDSVYLSVSGEIREPLRRYAFVFLGPDTTVAEVPAVDFGWTVGAAARFW